MGASNLDAKLKEISDQEPKTPPALAAWGFISTYNKAPVRIYAVSIAGAWKPNLTETTQDQVPRAGQSKTATLGRSGLVG